MDLILCHAEAEDGLDDLARALTNGTEAGRVTWRLGLSKHLP